VKDLQEKVPGPVEVPVPALMHGRVVRRGPGDQSMAIELNSDPSALTVSTCVHPASSLSSPFAFSSCSLARQPAFYPHRLVPSPQAPHGRQKLLCSPPAEASPSRSPCSSKLPLVSSLSLRYPWCTWRCCRCQPH
jgi:hypothetical protein